MGITTLSEVQTQAEAGNEIFKISRSFVDGSLIVSTRAIQTDPWVPLDVSLWSYIGGGYLRINPALAVGLQIQFSFSVAVDGVSSELDLIQRVAVLESNLAQQSQVLEIVLQSLEERLSKHTFRVSIFLAASQQSSPALKFKSVYINVYLK
jgi:hypothetical protein